MSNVLTIKSKKKASGGATVTKVFQCALAGSYLQSSGAGTPGELLNFNAALNPGLIARAKLPGVINGSIKALPPNSAFRVALASGFTAQVEQNATSPNTNNYVLRIFASDGTELPSALYSSVAAPLVAAGFAGLTIEVDVPQKFD
jgi:hypothetical protein